MKKEYDVKAIEKLSSSLKQLRENKKKQIVLFKEMKRVAENGLKVEGENIEILRKAIICLDSKDVSEGLRHYKNIKKIVYKVT